MAHKGVHVQVQAPMFVSTKLASIRKPRWDAPSPDSYAKVRSNPGHGTRARGTVALSTRTRTRTHTARIAY